MAGVNGNGHNGHNGNGASNGKVKKSRPSSAGRDHPTRAVAAARKLRAIEMFLAGEKPAHIATSLGVTRYVVNSWLREQRLQVLKETREHFNDQFALLLDTALSTVHTMTAMLGDEDFLEKADSWKIGAIADANGVLFDKCLILFAGLNRGAVEKQPEALRLAAGANDNGGHSGTDSPSEPIPGAIEDQDSGGKV